MCSDTAWAWSIGLTPLYRQDYCSVCLLFGSVFFWTVHYYRTCDWVVAGITWRLHHFEWGTSSCLIPLCQCSGDMSLVGQTVYPSQWGTGALKTPGGHLCSHGDVGSGVCVGQMLFQSREVGEDHFRLERTKPREVRGGRPVNFWKILSINHVCRHFSQHFWICGWSGHLSLNCCSLWNLNSLGCSFLDV